MSSAAPISITADNSGNYYLLGYYWGGNCRFDSITLINPSSAPMYFLSKLSSDGSVIWGENICNFTFAGTYPELTGGIGIDSSGSIYALGNFNNPSINIGGIVLNNSNTDSAGNYADFFVAKYDSMGNVSWAKKYGGLKNEEITSVAVAPDGSIYAVGSHDSTFSIGTTILTTTVVQKFFFVKFDSSGNVSWVNPLNNHIHPTQIITDFAGNIFMTGSFDSAIMLGSSHLYYLPGEDPFIAKFDSSGNVSWANGTGGYGTGWSIALDSCDNIWVCGSMGSVMNFGGSYVLWAVTGGLDPTFVAQYNRFGNFMSCFSLPCGGDDNLDIGVDNKGNVYVSGDYGNTSIMIFNTDTLPNVSGEDLFFAKYNSGPPVCSSPASDVKGVSDSPSGGFQENVKIYPNPVNTTLVISSLGKIDSILVVNPLGQIVYTNQYNTQILQLDVSNLPSGIYFLKINSTEVRKFVKQ